MSRVLRSFYHNLKEPIIICDFSSKTSLENADSKSKLENLNGVYFNKAFKKVFSDIFSGFNEDSADNPNNAVKVLKKLDNKFYFEYYLLESENLKTNSPLKDALEQKGSYSLYGMYQKSERKFLYFLIQAFSLKQYRIVYFYDLTREILLERLTNENEKLKIQNQNFLNTNSKAQNQAVKLAYLNRISTSISKTIDLNDLINTALKELNIIFGAKKTYFAKKKPNEEVFEIEYIYPNGFQNVSETDNSNVFKEILKYDKQITDEIFNNKISIQICLKENENSVSPFKTPLTRIILPIMKNENLIAVVVIFTSKKHIEEIEKELLVGVSMQISSAITQAMLFKEVSDKKEEVENALSELKETQLQLINSEKMASLGQLIASVAHEINTPLASICANNEILKRFFNSGVPFDDDTFEILKDTNSIDKEAIKRISNLVQSLKRFVRLDETVLQAANINEELDLTLNLLRHKLKKDINLIKNYGVMHPVNCYPNMLNQVFLNILMNAIQSIEKEADNHPDNYMGEISITTRVLDGLLSVKIEDNGFGIKEEDKKKIFHAGFTTKKVGEGTGLGLAICKKIIEKHNGTISFESGVIKKDGIPVKSTYFLIQIPV